MLDPAAARNQFADDLVAEYQRLELILLELIADKLARGLDAPDWAQRQVMELQRFRKEAGAIAAKMAGKSPELIAAAIQQAVTDGFMAASQDIATAEGVPAARVIANAGSVPAVDGLAIASLLAETTGALDTVNRGVLRASDDIYRRVVARASTVVVAGAETRIQATQRALNEFTKHGITGFKDARGRSWSLTAYTEMAIRTGTTSALMQSHSDRLTERGYDLVIVSSHPRPAPQCQPYERQILSLSGRTVGVIDETSRTTGRTVRVKVKASLAEAEARGLHHPNCKHRHSLFVPGVTDTSPTKADDDGYEDTQKLRYLERGTREWKRRSATALDPAEKKAAQAKAREWQARIKDHTDTTGVGRRRDRERIDLGLKTGQLDTAKVPTPKKPIQKPQPERAPQSPAEADRIAKDRAAVDLPGFPKAPGIELGTVVRVGNGKREYRVETLRTDGTAVLAQIEGAKKTKNVSAEDFAKLNKIRDDDTFGEARPVTKVGERSEQSFETQRERVSRHEAEYLWKNSPTVRRAYASGLTAAQKATVLEAIARNPSRFYVEMSKNGEDYKAPGLFARALEDERGTPFTNPRTPAEENKRRVDKAVKHLDADLSTYTKAELAAARRDALDIRGRSATAKQHRESLDYKSFGYQRDQMSSTVIEQEILHKIAIEQERRTAAAWLAAEAKYKTDVANWLAAEKAHKPRTLTETAGRSLGADVWKGYAETLDLDDVFAVRTYTGNSYEPINEYLRGLTTRIEPHHQDAVDRLDKVIERAPRVPESITVSRAVGADVYGLTKDTDPRSLTGRTFTDGGYLSTALQSALKAVNRDEVELRLDVPAGTRGVYVSSHPRGHASSLAVYGPMENELLLARGIEYEVTGAIVENGRQVLLARLTNQRSNGG